MPTVDECKKILSKLGMQLGVSPNLITTRLLDDHDKANMMTGDLSIDALCASIAAWKDNGFPDYAHGKRETLEDERKSLQFLDEPSSTTQVYQKPFVKFKDSHES
jgi:hypothetical protein